jgi:hypothetical protein
LGRPRFASFGFHRFASGPGCRAPRSGASSAAASFRDTAGSRRMQSPGSRKRSPTGFGRRVRARRRVTGPAPESRDRKYLRLRCPLVRQLDGGARGGQRWRT